MNPEQLRRALSRPNEATHPVELPDPADELAFFEHRVARSEPGFGYADPAVQRAVAEAIATNTVHSPWREGDPCELCNEPGTSGDPLAHFRHAVRVGDYVIAHGQCGEDDGLRLA